MNYIKHLDLSHTVPEILNIPGIQFESLLYTCSWYTRYTRYTFALRYEQIENTRIGIPGIADRTTSYHTVHRVCCVEFSFRDSREIRVQNIVFLVVPTTEWLRCTIILQTVKSCCRILVSGNSFVSSCVSTAVSVHTADTVVL